MSTSKIYLRNLKKLREKKGWTQEELAQKAGISYHTLIKIERGSIQNPRIETVVNLALALGIHLDKIVEY